MREVAVTTTHEQIKHHQKEFKMQYAIIPHQSENTALKVISSALQGFYNAQNVSLKTLEAYKKNIGYFVKWIKETNAIINSSEDVLRYKLHLQDRRLSSSTINAYMTSIRKLFKYLESKGISNDLTKDIKNEGISEGYKKKPLTPEELFLLKQSLSGTDLLSRRDLLLIALGVANGLRTIEMTRLTVGDLQEELNHNVLMIEGKGSKNGEKVSVILQDSTYEMIKQFIALQGLEGEKESFIFTSLSNFKGKKGYKPLTTSAVRYAIKKRFNEVGINDVMKTSHSLRHTHAHKLLDVGASPLEIQTSLRHKSFSSTEIYIKSRNKHKDPASLKIDFLS